ESVTEDILTTVKMLPDGYITRYLNERLSLGLAPENAKSLLIQRRRWARGSIQLMFLMFRNFAAKLSLRDWLFFFPLHYLMDFPCRILFALLPLVYLWTGYTHFYVHSTAELIAYQGPPILASFFLGRWLIPHARTPLLSAATTLYLSAGTYPAVLATLIKPFGAPFRVTPKGKAAQSEGGDPVALWALAILIAATVGGIVVGCQAPWRFSSLVGLIIATCWALCNLVLFGLTLLAVSQRSRPRGEERFSVLHQGILTVRGQKQTSRVINLSLTGALLENRESVEKGESVQLYLDGVGELSGTVVRNSGGKVAIHFAEIPRTERDKLILYLYASGLSKGVDEMKPFVVWSRLLKGAFFGSA
ncbi:MAG: PilZ domain-containing protein, partial [Thermoguttaceae bacterium]